MASDFDRCDLRKRTTEFAVRIVRFYSSLPRNKRYEVQVAARQILRSGTAVAAIFREASRARSKADFISKIEVCTQEADETLLWLDVLEHGCSLQFEEIGELRRETNEL